MLIACGQNTQQEKQSSPDEVNELKDKVMNVHDEVMPKMSELNRMARTLKDIPAERYEDIDSTMIRQHVQRLEDAQEAMMDWMANYNSSLDTMSKEKAKKYLLEEKQKIEQVAKSMNESLSEAKKWYQNEVEQSQ